MGNKCTASSLNAPHGTRHQTLFNSHSTSRVRTQGTKSQPTSHARDECLGLDVGKVSRIANHHDGAEHRNTQSVLDPQMKEKPHRQSDRSVLFGPSQEGKAQLK